MCTIIVGAGDVGYDVARMLSLQRHDVTVIDSDPDKVARIRDALDVMAIRGSGSSMRVLEDAGIQGGDLVIAVTDVDEVNPVVAMLAEHAGRDPVTIVRVRSAEFSGERAVLGSRDFGVNLIINPEAHHQPRG